jgi:hypothetical protein
MTDPDSREGSIWIEQTNRSGFFGRGEYVTFFFDFWQHQIPRGALTIVEGVQNREGTEKTARKVEQMRSDSEAKCSDCPKYFRFVCRAKDLVEVAKKIIETYEAFENRYKSET